MKKKYLFIALAATALGFASCSSDDVIGNGENGALANGEAITFNSTAKGLTRADQDHTTSASSLGGNFVLCGYKGTATAAANTGLVIDHYNVNYVASTANTTTSNTKDWEYVGQDMKVKGLTSALATTATKQTIKYWDHAATSYDFLAFSMGKGYTNGGSTTYATPTAVNSAALATAAYTFTGNANTLSECYISDITTVEEANYSATAVQMNFRHLTSKVRMALYETIPGYVVSAVKFRQTLTTSHEAASSENGILIGTGAFNEKGTLTVYFPTTGTDNKSNTDYNKAHVSFDADATDGTSSYKTFGAVDYKTVSEDAITTGSYLGLTSSTASYVKPDASGNAGDYLTVLPHENDSKVLSIQIDYTLTATDGSGEEIKVYGAQADVPAAYTAWKSGYAYTYIFKISQNTNGHTGTSTDDKGLTALSFDAVVLDDENGKQETITTVSTPSITTYGYKDGACTINGGEYATGTDIYATVQYGTSAVVPTNLYTVTIEDDAAQTINEASVANCLANATEVSGVWTVTDANTKKLTVTKVTSGVSTVDGSAADATKGVPTSTNTYLAVPAMKWTAGAAGTIYAVEYVKGADKYYKIVRIAK